MNVHQLRTRDLVARAYMRAKARHEMEAMGFPVSEVDADELWRRRFEDVIFNFVNRPRERQVGHLRVLAGGAGGSRQAGGGRPQEGQALRAVDGGQPPRSVRTQAGEHPTNFEREDG